MNTITTSVPITLLSLFLICAVLLCGAHAKDVVSATYSDHGVLHKVFGDDQGAPVKVTADLHNHVDKQGSHSIISLNGDQPLQADSRSLRVQHTKHKLRFAERLFAKWRVV